MLYQRWRQVADASENELALLDLESGCRWTFGQLAALSEKPPPEEGPAVFPQGASAEFILTVLRGWRLDKVVCPLETNQSRPAVIGLPRECRHVKTTSASTGPARYVAFTEGQLIADAANIVATMGLRPEWPNAALISLAHSYGFSNLVLPLLLHGIPLILAGPPLPERLRKLSRIAPAICLPAVPAMWRAWSDANAIGPHIRLAISAGAPLPIILEKHVLETVGLKIHNFYGASESGGIAYDRSDLARTEAECVGTPLENVTVKISPEGTLEVRSAAVGLCYWPEPAPELANGCFRTTDSAELRDRALLLRGRQTDTINVAGRKVAPETIERALLEHPDVRECVVFGVPDEQSARGDMIVACVASSAIEPTNSLRDFLLARLQDWQLPRDWWYIGELKSNERGKLSRAEWRRRYLARHQQGKI